MLAIAMAVPACAFLVAVGSTLTDWLRGGE
jgi:hypothetical protein